LAINGRVRARENNLIAQSTILTQTDLLTPICPL
jgi:hypothetical protein